MSLVTRRPLKRELRRTRPDAVVSTYPLASLVLGRMRKKKWLRVPVATYLTDFAVHPLWVHDRPGVVRRSRLPHPLSLPLLLPLRPFRRCRRK